MCLFGGFAGRFTLRAGCQGGAAALLGGVQLQLHLLDIEYLLFELAPTFLDLFQEALQLLLVAPTGVVHADQFLALGKREADALAAQDQLQRDPVARGVDALLPTPRWR